RKKSKFQRELFNESVLSQRLSCRGRLRSCTRGIRRHTEALRLLCKPGKGDRFRIRWVFCRARRVALQVQFYGRQARHPLLHCLPYEGPKKCRPDQSGKGYRAYGGLGEPSAVYRSREGRKVVWAKLQK